MKNRFSSIALLILILTHGIIVITSCSAKKESKTEEYENENEREREEGGEEEEDEKEETGADKQLSSWFWAKGYPDASNLTKKYQNAWQQYLELKKNNPLGGGTLSRVQSMGNWTFLGPKILGGRILSLAISPVAHLDGNRTIFAGSASGGIWKTYVSGIGAGAWQKVVTNTHVLGVQNIVYHPSDTNIILAGTGEVYRVETYTSGIYSSNQVSNIGRNAWKARGTYGIGILRSIDAGNTWTQTLIKTETDLFGIQKIKFQPGDPTVVFACATDGLYKSTNTGASWARIWTGNYCSDIVINPLNTNQIVIAAGNVTNNPKGIWRSTNGGTSFTQITGTGFPNFNQFRGFTALTMLGSSSTPDTIVASVGAGDVNVDGTYSEAEIYRSGDFGSTWASVSNSHHSRYQSWFSHGATMYPGNVAGSPRKVFIYGTASAVLTMSGTPATTGAAVTVGTNGGATFNSYFTDGQQEGTTSYLHSDVHDVQFWPGSSSIAYWATDGGVFRTANANVSPSSSMTFATCNGGLYAQQFYPSIAQSQASANILIGGLQDNQTVRYNGTGWARIIGGDGGPAMFKPDDETKVLGSSDTRGVYRSTNTGTTFPTNVLAYLGNVPFGSDDRTSFASPIAVCPSNTNRWYVGSDNIHVSTDAGVTFNNDVSNVPGTNYIEALHKPAIAIGVSSTNASKLYVSVSPFSQNISTDALFYNPPANLRKSTDGGTSFTTVTGSLPDRIITDIFVSPTNDDSVFVTLGGFGTTHIYVTGNGGTTWAPRGSGLPDLPFNTILIDPNNPQILYTGCDYGIYVSPDRGANWYDFNNGFWDATYVVDLALTPGNKIRAATHGKGIFEATRWDGIVILPVHFSSFTGVNQGVNNDLKWIVDQESNLSHYEVERSIDGFNYQVIKQVTARNSVLQTTYTATDLIGNNPSPNYYYRIKSVNQDGTYMYSEIVVIKISNKAKFEVLGNPFGNSLTIRYNVPQTGKLQLNLMDMQGRLFRREELIASVGTGTYTITGLSSAPAGMYLLNFDMNNTRTTIKVLKQ